MTNYRRFYLPDATWFFTVNLAKRRGNHLLVENIGLLRVAFYDIKKSRPFDIDAAVVMPEHLHCLLTFPPGDSDYSTRWGHIKGHFSRHIDRGERVSKSRAKRRERGLWQRRFWAHLITDQDDFNRHADYNPLESG